LRQSLLSLQPPFLNIVSGSIKPPCTEEQFYSLL
jgi:hypothetical protein